MPFSANELLAALPRLRRYARFLTNDPDRADDLVETTLARARQIRNERPSGAMPSTELLALLRAVYADKFARGPEQRSVVRTHANGESPPLHPGHSGGLIAHLLTLPLEQREVVMLVAVERMSYEEIAALLGVPVAAVIARLTQAREKLRSGPAGSLTEPKSAN
jgi:RNA polymerase sigma-70 factor (ECF subfamily)